MLCQTSGIFHLIGDTTKLDLTYENLQNLPLEKSLSKFLGLHSHTHKHSKLTSILAKNGLQFHTFVNPRTPQIIPIREFIQALRSWITQHHLTPEEVISATSLHHSTLTLLKGRIPKDPNIRALSIIVQAVSFPGGFGAAPATELHPS
jgi:hypothetical protein